MISTSLNIRTYRHIIIFLSAVHQYTYEDFVSEYSPEPGSSHFHFSKHAGPPPYGGIFEDQQPSQRYEDPERWAGRGYHADLLRTCVSRTPQARSIPQERSDISRINLDVRIEADWQMPDHGYNDNLELFFTALDRSDRLQEEPSGWFGEPIEQIDTSTISNQPFSCFTPYRAANISTFPHAGQHGV